MDITDFLAIDSLKDFTLKLLCPNRSSLKLVPPEQVNGNCVLPDIQARDLGVTVLSHTPHLAQQQLLSALL